MNRSSLLFFVGIAIAGAAGAACSASGNAAAGDDDGTEPHGDGGATDGGGHTYGNDSGEDEEAGPTCGSTTTPENCGECGNRCPGLDASADNVGCGTDGGTPSCSFSCSGEAYDVDNDAGNGCEVADTPTGNHATLAAKSLGDFQCYDGDSAQNFSGKIVSDLRVHEVPSVPGFDKTSGSAPDFWSINATGQSSVINPCEDNITLTMTLSGTTHGSCYTLTAVTDKGTYTCTPVTGATNCSFSEGSGSYSDDSLITISIAKTCSAATVRETASYTITGHL